MVDLGILSFGKLGCACCLLILLLGCLLRFRLLTYDDFVLNVIKTLVSGQFNKNTCIRLGYKLYTKTCMETQTANRSTGYQGIGVASALSDILL